MSHQVFELNLVHINRKLQRTCKSMLIIFSTAISILLNKYNECDTFVGVKSKTGTYVPVFCDFENDKSFITLMNEFEINVYYNVKIYNDDEICIIGKSIMAIVEAVMTFD